MSLNGSSTRDSALYHTPRQSAAHSSFGSPFASDDPFSQLQVPPARVSGSVRRSVVAIEGAPLCAPGSGSVSPVSMQSRGSTTAQAIIESTQALEAELQRLRQSQNEKDREIAALKASIALTAFADPGANGQARKDPSVCVATDDLAEVVKAADEAEEAVAEAYTILSPAFGHLRRVYAKSLNLPIVGGVARVSLRAADACVSRTTKWSSCEHVGKDVDGLLQYVDEQVLTPHLQAARHGSLALCEPALKKVNPLFVRSSALLTTLLSTPRGFAEAFGRRATVPAVWLREALRGWFRTPPGRLAMEDKLRRSAEAAAAANAAAATGGTGGAASAAATTGGTGGLGTQLVVGEEQAAEAPHD